MCVSKMDPPWAMLLIKNKKQQTQHCTLWDSGLNILGVWNNPIYLNFLFSVGSKALKPSATFNISNLFHSNVLCEAVEKEKTCIATHPTPKRSFGGAGGIWYNWCHQLPQNCSGECVFSTGHPRGLVFVFLGFGIGVGSGCVCSQNPISQNQSLCGVFHFDLCIMYMYMYARILEL